VRSVWYAPVTIGTSPKVRQTYPADPEAIEPHGVIAAKGVCVPIVSVVLPVRNGARWIGEALQSVAAQTRPPDENLVIDGQSIDGSAAIAARFDRVRIIPQPDLGVSGGLNLGFAEAGGDVVTMISCDDRWRPDKLERQIARLDDAALDVVFGHVRFFTDPGDESPAIRRDLLTGSHPGHLLEVMLIRREAAARVGPFRADLAVATDVDWFARLAQSGARKAMLDEVLVDKRLHAGGNSADPARAHPELLTALRSAVARKRAGGNG
jgi:glycosyltransferase involved in cell wall biosynthesis